MTAPAARQLVYHPRRLKVLDTGLPEVKIVEPAVFGDTRGWFMETYSARLFREAGLPTVFAQDNHSYSRGRVIRGLHYQLRDPQGKLVRCTRGAILDVAVDIRRSSQNFGRWTAVELTAANRRMLWVPPRFAHGFAVLGEEAEVLYKCTTLWDHETDRSLLWNDPEIAIRWPLSDPEISEKDAAGKPLRDAELFES